MSHDTRLYKCHECEWEGEGIELTEDGECPECYALIDEDFWEND
jgi:DNA-directed RNA polymerase subunit RPC12/RpoP